MAVNMRSCPQTTAHIAKTPILPIQVPNKAISDDIYYDTPLIPDTAEVTEMYHTEVEDFEFECAEGEGEYE